MSIYTPSAVGLVPFEIPDDGDDVTAASVGVAFEMLGDGITAISPPLTREVSPDAVRYVSALLAPSPAVGSLGTMALVTTTEIENSHSQLGTFVTKTVNTMNNGLVFYIPLDDVGHYHGYTLVSVALRLIGKAGHAALPANMPRIALVRYGASGNTSLLSTTWAVDSSGSTGAYETEHSVTITTDQNRVVDASQYRYALLLQNEGNTNATNGLQARRIILTLTAPV